MKVIGKILAVIICTIYSILLTVLIVLGFGTNVVSSNYYANVLENIDLQTIKVSDLEDFFDENQFDKDATLEDVLIEYFSEEDVDEAKIKALLNDKKARKTAGKVIGEIASYAMGGEKPEITRKEIEDFFDNPVVIDVTGKPTKEDIDNLYEEINEAIEEVKGGIDSGNTKRNSESVEVLR